MLIPWTTSVLRRPTKIIIGPPSIITCALPDGDQARRPSLIASEIITGGGGYGPLRIIAGR